MTPHDRRREKRILGLELNLDLIPEGVAVEMSSKGEDDEVEQEYEDPTTLDQQDKELHAMIAEVEAEEPTATAARLD